MGAYMEVLKLFYANVQMEGKLVYLANDFQKGNHFVPQSGVTAANILVRHSHLVGVLWIVMVVYLVPLESLEVVVVAYLI